jgi:N-methylhydantoinase A
VQTLVQRLDAPDSLRILRKAGETVEAEIRDIFTGEGIVHGVEIERTADMRYSGQEHTINVPMPPDSLGEEQLQDLCRRFHEQHGREYGFTLRSAVEVVNLRFTGVVRVSKPTPAIHRSAARSMNEALAPERPVYWGAGQKEQTRIYRRELLPESARFDGPAIVEESSTTIVVPHSFAARVDEWGNIVLWRK